MGVPLAKFLEGLAGNPALIIISALTLGVTLVNGWTDAPNAIATCVSTRSMSARGAILMAAVMNFFGIFIMTSINSTVALTIYNMADFGEDSSKALVALGAALFAITAWSAAAWLFGIPTSESHALIAGISGAALAVQGGFSGINGEEWLKVAYGLAFSGFAGFFLGWISAKAIGLAFSGADRRKTGVFFKNAQIFGAGAMAFMHGAQDGQKFIGVFLLGMSLAEGQGGAESFQTPAWLMALCSFVMAAGTSIGGLRIIKTVGMSMVKLEKYQGFSADMAAAACLLISSLTGTPVSTTHVKTTAIMGAGAATRFSSVNWGVAGEMLMAWGLTFPGCGFIGFLMARLFLHIF